MTVLPVIARELRAESRHPINYWLRLVGAAGLLAVCAWLWSQQQQLSANSGGRVFYSLNATLFAAIWLFGPLLTADSISGERREGTLGLLFLTPLRAQDIVVAKLLTHGLRALSLFLAGLPILIIPIMMGGVGWADAVRALLLDLGAFTLALAAGIFASSCCREWVRTMVLSLNLSFLSALLFVGAHGLCRALQLFPKTGLPHDLKNFLYFLWPYAINRFGRFTFGGDSGPGPFPRNPGKTSLFSNDLVSVLLAAGLLILACLVSGLLLLEAARRIKTYWQETPPSRRTLWFLRTFCTTLFWRSLIQREMRRKLERNPIAWLHQYSWSARLTKWGWCLAIVSVETVLSLAYDPWSMLPWQHGLANLVFLGMSFSAVSSFRKERQSGALELLLVTPLRESQVIGGRLCGIWLQFVPAMTILIIVGLLAWGTLNLFSNSIRGQVGPDYPPLIVITLLGRYAIIPIIGLYLSMLRIHYILAALLTFTLGTCAPALLRIPLVWGWRGQAVPEVETLLSILILLIQATIGLLVLYILNSDLKNRRFSFS